MTKKYTEVTYEQAVELAKKGNPFRLRWQFVGPNPKNKSGESRKFWELWRNDAAGPVHITYGPITTLIPNADLFNMVGGTTKEVLTLQSGLMKGRFKEKKGYKLVLSAVCSEVAALIKEPPKISASGLPWPFTEIRMIHDVGTGDKHDFVAFDREGREIAHLPLSTAVELRTKYTLA